MKRLTTAFVLLGVLGIGLLAAASYFSGPTEAQRGVSTRFEYAVINGSYSPFPPDGPSTASSAVNICYMQASGCQNEEVRAEIVITKFLQDERLENVSNSKLLAGYRAMNTAYAKAFAKLGADGWELVEAPEIELDLYYTNPQGIQTVKTGQQTERKHVWFKRVRQ